MRNQSNELIILAKELRSHIDTLSLEIPVGSDGVPLGILVDISNNLRVHYNPLHNYMSVDVSKQWPNTVSIALFESSGYSNNTITINTSAVSDADLDELILRFTEDIVTFKASNVVEHVPTN